MLSAGKTISYDEMSDGGDANPVTYNSSRIVLDHGPNGNFIKAAVSFKPEETICRLTGKIIVHPTKYTIQLDENIHVLDDGCLWQKMNHSCEPNVRIDVLKREMVAVRDISRGEELNFNYNSTEWSMTSPFLCGCGAASCAGEIRGFCFLSEEQRQTIKPLLSTYIARRWSEIINGNYKNDISIRNLSPEVQVLIPYMVRNGNDVSPDYDNEAFSSELNNWFAPLNLPYVCHPVTITAIEEVIARIVQRGKETPIVVLNLCDGTEFDGYPGKSLIEALTREGLPYSGAGALFYEMSTSKLATKRLLQASGVSTSEYTVIEDMDRDLPAAMDKIGMPLFIKPDISGGSYGISLDSICYDLEAARKKITRLRADEYFQSSAILAEPFIDGREFTVLVVEDKSQPLGLFVLPPGERVFNPRIPANERFLAYERYWELPEEDRPIPADEHYYWYQLASQDMKAEIEMLARRAVRAIDGSGYARVDIRHSQKDDKLYVLEVNAQCGLSADASSTVGSLLNLAGLEMSEIMELVLNHALNRNHRQRV